jgi:CRP-like cAMP-binding protein
MEQIPLNRKQMLYDQDREIEHVYFLTEGVASVLTVLSDGTAIETATIGNEGLVGIYPFLGRDMVRGEHAFMQIGGHGFRMDTADFRAVLPQCPQLSNMVARYTLALVRFLSLTSACNRKHSIEQRCARWLLLTHDRAGRDTIELTQQFLSQMLGVRRATVNAVMGSLHEAGCVDYTRGRVTILDRGCLEKVSCDCYKTIRREFEEALGN